MATVIQPLHSEPTANSLYPRAIMGEFEFGENRYPSLRPQSRSTQQSSGSRPTTAERLWQQTVTNTFDNQQLEIIPDSLRGSLPWQQTGDYQQESQISSSRKDQRVLDSQTGQHEQMQDVSRPILSYGLPPGAARWATERYPLEDNFQRSPSRTSNGPNQLYIESQSIQETVTLRNLPRSMVSSRVNPSPGRASPNHSLGRRSPIQIPSPLQDGQIPPIIPLSASPTYSPPVAPNPRAYAQQPTYVNQGNAGNAIQPVYTPIVPQQEEVCVECAMRDKDMADVDVSSPGVWDRASDVVFEELKRREMEEEAAGIINTDHNKRRIKGGRLTEQNVKLWLSINPREPASKQQTLSTYIRSQRALLEAEALAHARAMQEAKLLDNRVRDAYAGIRMSAYAVGTVASPIDDLGGVRIRPPTTPSTPANHRRTRSQSREVTLLENGLIVEHVDIKKEEKEARERRRKEEKRARKSSRSSAMDVNSIISQSSGQLVDGGLKPSSRMSQAHSVRTTSVFSKSDRIDLPRAYSQLSFSDAQSLGSASPRRTRFFGFKNLNGGWSSQDSLAPSGMSGSMVDMHVALQRDASNRRPHPIDLNTPNRSQIWPPGDLGDSGMSQVALQEAKSKKKVGGLARIWRKVTGKTDEPERDATLQLDDSPLPLPPSLSYLVERKPPMDFGPTSGNRHGSTPSLPSISSPKVMMGQSPGMSPPTAPSSILPSPASLQQFGDIEILDGRQTMYSDSPGHDDPIRPEETTGQQNNKQPMQSFFSEPDLRPQNLQNGSIPQVLTFPNGAARPTVLSRDKSLPPIPVGEAPTQVLSSERPKTFYALESTPKMSSRDLAPPEAPFRGTDRRQSFSGTPSRPNTGVQTLPVIRPVDFDSGRSFGGRYDEFGSSRRSLGVLDNHIQENQSHQPTKRKSKFGLSSLLGKKNDKREQGCDTQLVASPPYDAQDDMTTTGYATSTSRHSALSSSAANMRVSTYSRKPLEGLVQQETEFLAYRYPSNDQRLDLLR